MEPGLDRQQWVAEMSALEEQLADSPDESLPELSPGDVGAAVNGYQAVYEHIVSANDRAS